MSAKATFWAWDQKLKSTQKLVLLCLSDCHNADTNRCDPSIAYISDKTGLDRKTIMNCIVKLTESSLISPCKLNGARTTYSINFNNETSTEYTTSTKSGTSTKYGTPPVPNTVPVPVPNMVPEPITNLKEPKTIKSEPTKSAQCPHVKIIEMYHEILPELDRVLINLWAGTPRAKNLQARWRESEKHQDLEFWRWYFTELRQEDFYLGVNDRNWKPNLEWLVNKKNFVKRVEKYVSRQAA